MRKNQKRQSGKLPPPNKINPYNKIVAGLIYMKTGNKRAAKTLFDEFITNNPDMLITSDIKRILKKL